MLLRVQRIVLLASTPDAHTLGEPQTTVSKKASINYLDHYKA